MSQEGERGGRCCCEEGVLSSGAATRLRDLVKLSAVGGRMRSAVDEELQDDRTAIYQREEGVMIDGILGIATSCYQYKDS